MIYAFTVTSLVFSILAFVGAFFACVQVEAFKRSTHQVTYFDPASQKFASELTATEEPKETEDEAMKPRPMEIM